MAPNQTLYRHLQITLFSGSCLIVVFYAALFYGQFFGPGELLGTSPLNLFIAGLHGLYFILLRGFIIRQKSHVTATLVDLIFFSLNILVLLLATGGFSSPYFVFWLLVIVVSAAISNYAVATYVILTVIYLAVATILSGGAIDYLNNNAVYAAASIAAGMLGLWLWRNHPVEQTNNNKTSELEEKLQLEQLKSEILLKSIGDGVLVIDLSGTIQLFNPPAAEITGWSEEEATGLGYKHIMPLQDEEGNALTDSQDPFQQAITSKKSFRRKDIILMNRQQKKLHISLTVAPIFASADNVTGAVAVFSDISQEKMASRQRDEFISTASHEMRTPVAAIEGYLALAMNPRVSNIDENAKKYIDKAHTSTQHLGKLFQDLLSVTKLEDGRISNNPEPFELGKVIKTAIDELKFKAEQKSLDLKLKSAQGATDDKSGVMPLFYVNADPERIREVFINLVDNAIKFTPQGEVNISITGDDKSVTVGIHDQGIGIPQEEVKHLFQKFYRIDNSKTREIGGTGLGLYLCRTIIEMYNGRIWVESEEGKGSNFYFSLPRLTYSQAQELRAKLEKEGGKTEGSEEETKQAGEVVAPTTTNT